MWTGEFVTRSMESGQVGFIEAPSSISDWTPTILNEIVRRFFFKVPPRQVPDSFLYLRPSAFLHILSNSLCVATHSLDRAQS